jgi:hypothetical protein
LIQPGAVKLLDWLVDSQLPVNLNITTNLTNLSTRVIERLKHFSQIDFALSIDSVNDNYEYIRWPAKFNVVEENLRVIAGYTNASITVQMVWSLYNIFHINEILDWWHNWFQLNKEIPLRNVAMYRPYYMSIQNLPVAYRRHLLELINQALAHPIFKSSLQESLHFYLSGIVEFLRSEVIVHSHFDLFLHETARHDKATDTSFKTGNWRFYRALTEQDRQKFASHPNLNLLPSQQQTVYNLQLPL